MSEEKWLDFNDLEEDDDNDDFSDLDSEVFFNSYDGTADEEDNQDNNKKFGELLNNPISVSIVPDGIKKVRVVSLVLDDVIVAYRVKTDKGNFDITLQQLVKMGINGFKTDKLIRLHNVNGMLLSNSEIENRKNIPDISNNEADCRKIVDLLYKHL